MECTLPQNDLVHWFALLRAPSITTASIYRILDEFGSLENIFHMDAESLLRSGLPPKTVNSLRHPDWNAVDEDLEWHRQSDHHLITCIDDRYPVLLKEIHDSPPALYLSGDAGILSSMQISIVGSRRPSVDGRRNTVFFAGMLARLGLTITSGLAAGLDSEAHKSALAAEGKSIAVLGSGLNHIYPKSNIKLSQQIIEKRGAVISELPPDFGPRPMNFPRRNRIISGLSLGTLVVEAAANSGSLITARCAMEQGREVFAVPGSIHNPLTRGCHELIRQGANLAENVNDILVEIGPLASLVSRGGQDRHEDDKKIKGLDELDKLLLDNIGSRPVPIDSLVEMTALTVPVVSARLLKLELAGLIVSAPGGTYLRV